MSLELHSVSKANLNTLKGLDITKEIIKTRVRNLAFTEEGLRRILSQSSRLSDFCATIDRAIKDVIIEKAKANGITDETMIIETDEGNITITPRESVILLEETATRILQQKKTGTLSECSKVTLDLDKIRKLKKANVITEEEWLEMTVKGQPTYAISIK